MNSVTFPISFTKLLGAYGTKVSNNEGDTYKYDIRLRALSVTGMYIYNNSEQRCYWLAIGTY